MCNQFCKSFVFADDVHLLFSGGNILSSFETSINDHLCEISDWMLANNLSINPTKTKAIQFFLSNHVVSHPNIYISGVSIQYVDHLKCLGIYLDQKLNFYRHVSHISSKVFIILRRLYSISSYMPKFVKKRVAYALLMSNINYCIEIIAGSKINTLTRLEKVFNRILRFVYNLKICDHVTNSAIDFLACTAAFIIIGVVQPNILK